MLPAELTLDCIFAPANVRPRSTRKRTPRAAAWSDVSFTDGDISDGDRTETESLPSSDDESPKRQPKRRAGKVASKQAGPANFKNARASKHDPISVRRMTSGKAGLRCTSRFRGVTHHCRTGRYESHIWDCGKQVYLGGFDTEAQAALAYDLAAVKCRGPEAATNFGIENYRLEISHIDAITKEDLVNSLRQQSKGFHQNSSRFRGVTRHQKGKWEARIGRVVGRKYKYLGLFSTEAEAAVAYDRAAVATKALDALTNFPIVNYIDLLSAADQEVLQATLEKVRREQKAAEPESRRPGVRHDWTHHFRKLSRATKRPSAEALEPPKSKRSGRGQGEAAPDAAAESAEDAEVPLIKSRPSRAKPKAAAARPKRATRAGRAAQRATAAVPPPKSPPPIAAASAPGRVDVDTLAAAPELTPLASPTSFQAAAAPDGPALQSVAYQSAAVAEMEGEEDEDDDDVYDRFLPDVRSPSPFASAAQLQPPRRMQSAPLRGESARLPYPFGAVSVSPGPLSPPAVRHISLPQLPSVPVQPPFRRERLLSCPSAPEHGGGTLGTPQSHLYGRRPGLAFKPAGELSPTTFACDFAPGLSPAQRDSAQRLSATRSSDFASARALFSSGALRSWRCPAPPSPRKAPAGFGAPAFDDDVDCKPFAQLPPRTAASESGHCLFADDLLAIKGECLDGDGDPFAPQQPAPRRTDAWGLCDAAFCVTTGDTTLGRDAFDEQRLRELIWDD